MLCSWTHILINFDNLTTFGMYMHSETKRLMPSCLVWHRSPLLVGCKCHRHHMKFSSTMQHHIDMSAKNPKQFCDGHIQCISWTLKTSKHPYCLLFPIFTSILYNSHFLKYCETRHHHIVFFQDIEETEAFGGLDSCSGVKCTGAGLLGLGTYDWKTLGCVSVKRTYSTNLPKNRGSYHRCHPSFFSREDFWKKNIWKSMNFLGNSWNQKSRFRLRDGGWWRQRSTHPGNGPEVSVYPSLAMPRGCESTTIVETWSIMVKKNKGLNRWKKEEREHRK